VELVVLADHVGDPCLDLIVISELWPREVLRLLLFGVRTLIWCLSVFLANFLPGCLIALLQENWDGPRIVCSWLEEEAWFLFLVAAPVPVVVAVGTLPDLLDTRAKMISAWAILVPPSMLVAGPSTNAEVPSMTIPP
jgi:hypothetical protein